MGYGREGLDRCRPCPERTYNVLLSVIGILIVLIVLVIFIFQTMKSAADDRSTSSMLLKTAAAYAQVLSIARSFPYEWPNVIQFETMGHCNKKEVFGAEWGIITAVEAEDYALYLYIAATTIAAWRGRLGPG